MTRAKQQPPPLDHELLAVAFNGLTTAPRNMAQVMAALERLKERTRGDVPLLVRHRARSVTEGEVADALEVLVERGDIRKGKDKKGVPTYARKN